MAGTCPTCLYREMESAMENLLIPFCGSTGFASSGNNILRRMTSLFIVEISLPLPKPSDGGCV